MHNAETILGQILEFKVQLDIIKVILHHPSFRSISEGQQGKRLADMSSIAPYVAGFSDDGYGVQTDYELAYAKTLNKIIAHIVRIRSRRKLTREAKERG